MLHMVSEVFIYEMMEAHIKERLFYRMILSLEEIITP